MNNMIKIQKTKNNELPVLARLGMTKSFYAGIQEGYKDALEEIREMKETFENNDKEMFVLNSLEKTILLSSHKEENNEIKAMSVYNVVPKKQSLLNGIFKNLFKKKKAIISDTLDGSEMTATNEQ